MKKTVMVLIIALMAASVFAEGRQEKGRFDRERPEPELVKVAGELRFGNFGEPYIVQDDVAYILMVPYAHRELDEIKEGDKIVAEGYDVPMRRFWNQDKTRRLRVVKGSVNGKEIDIEKILNECGWDGDFDPDRRMGPPRGRKRPPQRRPGFRDGRNQETDE